MAEINYIKHLRNEKSFSMNQIINTLGINWRTAKKYADEDQYPNEGWQSCVVLVAKVCIVYED